MVENQIRDLVHTVKSSDLTATQIKNGFGEIFLSRDTLENQLETQEIVEMTRSVKAPYYGQAIPGATQVIETAGAAGLVKMFTAEENTGYQVQAFSIDNGGSGAIRVRVGVTDVGGTVLAVVYEGEVPAATLVAVPDMIGIRFDVNSIPAFLVTSGTPQDSNFQLCYSETVQ